MTRDQARQEIRQRIKCTDYLTKSKGGLYNCPYCGSGTHERKTGALEVYHDNLWRCHACGQRGDIIDLYRQLTTTDYNAALTQLAGSIGITIDPRDYALDWDSEISEEGRSYRSDRENCARNDFSGQESINTPAKQNAPQSENKRATEQATDYREYFRECAARLTDPAATAYLERRGISMETAQRYGLGYDPAADPANAPGGIGAILYPTPRIIIPTSPTHYVGRATDTAPATSYPKMNPKGGKPGIFGERELYGDAPAVYVTEGPFDALSVAEAGCPAIALCSTSNADEFATRLERQPPTVGTLILSFDGDKAGRECTRKLEAELDRLKIRHITADIRGSYGDPNEALTADRETFIEAVKRETGRAIRPHNTANYIKTRMGDDMERFRQGTENKTGFPNLDEKAGGLYTGLYVLAATSSLGKTSFMLQAADQIASAGTDVIYFSLEQSCLELVSMSLARISAEADPANALSSLSVRRGYSPTVTAAAAQTYQERIGERLSIVEGNFDCTLSFVGSYIKSYIKRTGKRPTVILDYLQILTPEPDSRGRMPSTKDATDAAVTGLKRLSRELDLTIIVISSVNRANYLTPIDFESLKESGGIEYSADVVWGLQLRCLDTDPTFETEGRIKAKREAIKEAKKATPREIKLVCLKNRFGIASYEANFDYYPASSLFRPAADDEEGQGSKKSKRVR